MADWSGEAGEDGCQLSALVGGRGAELASATDGSVHDEFVEGEVPTLPDVVETPRIGIQKIRWGGGGMGRSWVVESLEVWAEPETYRYLGLLLVAHLLAPRLG